MKRDMDLVRKILLAIEEDPTGHTPKCEFEGYSEQDVRYNAVSVR